VYTGVNTVNNVYLCEQSVLLGQIFQFGRCYINVKVAYDTFFFGN